MSAAKCHSFRKAEVLAAMRAQGYGADDAAQRQFGLKLEGFWRPMGRWRQMGPVVC